MPTRYSENAPEPKSPIGAIVFVLGTIAAFLILFPPWKSEKERTEEVTEKVMQKVIQSEKNVIRSIERALPLGLDTLKAEIVTGDLAKLNPIVKEIFKETKAMHNMLNPTNELGEIYRINKFAGKRPVVVKEDIFEIVKAAKTLHEQTGGLFDVSLLPYYRLWHFGTHKAGIPDEKKLDAWSRGVGMERVQLDEKAKSVYLPIKGMGLDFRMMKRGLLLDYVKNRLLEEGFTDFFLLIGSDAIAHGKMKEGQSWRISLQHPKKALVRYGSALFDDAAVVTANYFEKSFVKNGKRHHPYLHPKTGRPGYKTLTVAVRARSAAIGEALAYAAFLLGPKKGVEFLDKFEGVEGVIMDVYQKTHETKNAAKYFTIKERKRIE